MNRTRLLVLLVGGLSLGPGTLSAVQNLWTGAAADHLWTNRANWSLAALPGPSQDVLIPDTGGEAVVLNAPASVQSLTLGSPSGSATLTLTGGSLQCSAAAQVQANSTLDLAGSLTAASLTVAGSLNWNAGSLTAPTLIASLGHLTISTLSNSLSGTFRNDGTFTCLATNLVTDSNLLFTNNNLLVLQTNCTLSGQGTFVNHGTLLAPAGSGTVALLLGDYLNFDNYGTLRAETNSVLEVHLGINASGLVFEDGTFFDGAGTIRFAGEGNFNLLGTQQVNTTLELAGPRAIGPSLLTGPGLFSWLNGSLYAITFDQGFQVQMSGPADKTFSADCVNLGTIRWTDNAQLSFPADGGFNNAGLFILQTNCTLSGQGTFVNHGTLLAPAGSGTVALFLGDYFNFDNYGTLRAETNSVLEVHPAINSSVLVFEDGTFFDGAGTVRFAGEGNFNCLGTQQVGTTVELAGCWCVGQSLLTGPGLFRWLSGTLVDFTFDQGFQVQMSGAGDKTFGFGCVNLGTVRWAQDASLNFTVAGSFDNAGLFILQTNCSLSEQGTFMNHGTILAPAGSGTVPLFLGESLNFDNYGTLRAETNSVLEVHPAINSSGLIFENGSFFDGAGTVRFAGEGNFICLGTQQVNTTMELAGPLALGPSLLAGPGLFRWLSGSILDFTFTAEAHVEASGLDNKYLQGNCTNLGSFRWLSPSALVANPAGGSLENGGLLSLESACTWDPAIALDILPGGILRQVAGQSSLGLVENYGTMELNAGTLSLNSLVCEPQATCRWTLSSANPETGFSPVRAGALSLNGVLAVTLTNGFTPAKGTCFVLATNLTGSGRFTSTSLPPLSSGSRWRVLYQTNDLTLKVVAPTVLSAAAEMADGSFQFTLSEGEGSGYQIQTSTNLTDWVTLLTNGPFSAPVTFADTNAAQFGQRFYRARISD